MSRQLLTGLRSFLCTRQLPKALLDATSDSFCFRLYMWLILGLDVEIQMANSVVQLVEAVAQYSEVITGPCNSSVVTRGSVHERRDPRSIYMLTRYARI